MAKQYKCVDSLYANPKDDDSTLAVEAFCAWCSQSGSCSTFEQVDSSVVIGQESIKNIDQVYETISLGIG